MSDEIHIGLTVRKLADRSWMSGDEAADNAVIEARRAAGEDLHPLAGIQMIDAPTLAKIPTSWVDMGTAEGWITLTDPVVTVKPGGPPSDPWRADKIHVFRHASGIVIHTVDGDVRYRVTRQPDKYEADGSPVDLDPQNPAAAVGDPTRTIDFFYLAEREA